MITVEEIKKQQEELQFESFNNEVAYDIGNRLFEKAKERKLPVAISISRCNHELFYIALPGAKESNELWLKRKVNSCYFFQKSTILLEMEQSQSSASIMQINGLPEDTYAPAAGAFPVILKGTGMVGVIAVSGLAGEDDHALVIEAVKEYLNSK